MSTREPHDLAWRRVSDTTGEERTVEVAFVDGEYWLRDSRDHDGAIIAITTAEFDAFAHGLRIGTFDSSMWP